MSDEELVRFGKDVRRLAENPFQRQLEETRRELRIPDDADQRSGLMPITHSERCRSVIPGDADHSFRGDPDQFDQDRRKSDREAPERFPQGEVTLDITEGKLFLHLIYGETECQPGDSPCARSKKCFAFASN
jgi:hypothetical protein